MFSKTKSIPATNYGNVNLLEFVKVVSSKLYTLFPDMV